MVTSSDFVIKELGGDQRTFILRGRAMPYKPFELDGEQDIEFTKLPGVPVRTATVLGPLEQPTTISGMWKTRFLGAGNLKPPFEVSGLGVFSARDAVKAMDSLRLLGGELEVTWLDTLRRGFLKRFRQKWETSEDVGFELTFEWTSRGERVAPAVFQDTNSGAAFADVKGLFDFLDQIKVPDFPLADEILNALQTFSNGISNLVLDLEDAVQSLTDKVLSPVRAIQGIRATLQSLESECGLMLEFLAAQPETAFSARDPAEQGYSERQSAALYREELRAWAAELRRVSVEQRTSLAEQVETELLATYVAREGDDLRNVSSQFYGTPFEWRRLATFNDLSDMRLESGQLVLVPPLVVSQAGQQAPGV